MGVEVGVGVSVGVGEGDDVGIGVDEDARASGRNCGMSEKKDFWKTRGTEMEEAV